MTTLTAVIVPASASVTLTVASAPAGAVVITRTDTNGTAPVRLRDGQVPISGSLIAQDYEVSYLGSATYDLVDSAGGTATVTLFMDLAGAGPRIGSVQLPTLTVAPQAVTGYDSSRSSGSVVHWPIDRADPVVIVKPARTREGTLTLYCASYSDAHSTAAVLAPGRLLMLRQGDHPGLDMYFATMRADVAPQELVDAGWSWTVLAEYVEVKAPPVPLLGEAGWSFAAVTAGYATFSAVRSEFSDFAALTVGPT